MVCHEALQINTLIKTSPFEDCMPQGKFIYFVFLIWEMVKLYDLNLLCPYVSLHLHFREKIQLDRPLILFQKARRTQATHC